MRTLGLVELERVRDGVEDGLRGSPEVATLEAYVVLDAHAGEQRHLLASQALHAAVAAPGGQTRVLRGETGTA